MTLIVLSAYPDRVETNAEHWGSFQIFNPGLVGLREAHLDLALHAVQEWWDEKVHVIQDDVIDVRRNEHFGEITSYWPSFTGQDGFMRYRDHVCPKSFSATRVGWRRLVVDWSRVGKTCNLWSPDFAYSAQPERNQQLVMAGAKT